MPHFLIVDGNQEDRKLAEEALNGLNYNAICSASAAEALRHCRGSKRLPNGILIDSAQAPAFLEEFRKLRKSKGVHIVVWSGTGLQSEAVALSRTKMVYEFLAKPTPEARRMNVPGQTQQLSYSQILQGACNLKTAAAAQ